MTECIIHFTKKQSQEYMATAVQNTQTFLLNACTKQEERKKEEKASAQLTHTQVL